MVAFLVNLVRVPNMLTEAQQRELTDNECRHVEGRYWIFEGDIDALETPVRFIAEGVTTGTHPDDVPPGEAIIAHCKRIFGLRSWPPERP